MKIGIVCYPTFGGSGVVATELGKELAARNHVVHFITYHQPVRLQGFNRNIFYHQVNPQNYPLFDYVPYESALASKMVDVTLHHHLDLLHVHYAIPHASSAFLAQSILQDMGVHVPFITTLHGTDITLVGRDKSYLPVVTFSINKSNGVTSVSDYLKDATYEHFAIRKEIEVIPNFVDLKRFDASKRCPEWRNCFAENQEKVLLHASNFRKVKRTQDVYEIFKLVKSEMNVKLLLVGDGPDRQSLEERSRDEGYADSVIFLGNQDVIEDILPMGDVFIFPSENESFGLAALEAMACGLPVVGTHTGGLPELVQDGISGFLCTTGDIKDMAQKTLKILSSAENQRYFSKNAVARAVEFSNERIITQYERYYEKVLNEYSPHQSNKMQTVMG